MNSVFTSTIKSFKQVKLSANILVVFLFSLFLTVFLFGVKTPAACDADTAPNCQQWTTGATQKESLKRNYSLYVPSQLKQPSTPAPLVVMLHGCMQSADDFAKSTRMNFKAEKLGFVVLYPEQSSKDNPLRCWNWFKPENQARQTGEAALIIELIEKIKSQIPIDTKKIFVAGISAGGAMAHNLGSCYPDVFSAVAVHSGVAFKSAESEAEAHQAMKSGSKYSAEQAAELTLKCSGQTQVAPLFVVSGSQDFIVNSANQTQLMEQTLATYDLLDNGKTDKSFTANKQTSTISAQAPLRPYELTTVITNQNQVIIKNIVVQGMGHAWSGGNSKVQFSDDKGPDVSDMMLDFFLHQ